MIKHKLKEATKDPAKIIIYLLRRIAKQWDDEFYLKVIYFLTFRKKLNLDNPQTFNEKLQWLKLYDRRPEYTIMVDKYAVRKYVAEKIGNEYLIPLLGVWNDPDDIDFDSLPNQFVLKCNHDSGGICICKDKSKINIEKVKARLRKSLNHDYYKVAREWPYKNVPRRIIAEQYMEDESGYELKDYKIFNFNGSPKLIEVDFDRFKSHKRNIYTIDWNFINLEIQYPSDSNKIIERPKQLDKILTLCQKLSEGIPHIRTDFYVINDKVYFGELTLYHGSGTEKFKPKEWDYKLGQLLQLPDV